MRKFLIILTVMMLASVGVIVGQQIGTGNPPDNQVIQTRLLEVGCTVTNGVPTCPATGSGIFDIAVPTAGTQYRPVQRVPRDQFGQVGAFPLQLSDLNSLVYPATTLS